MTMEMFGVGAKGHFSDENDEVDDVVPMLETEFTPTARVEAVLTPREEVPHRRNTPPHLQI